MDKRKNAKIVNPASPAGGGGIRVLLVDDHPLMRQAVKVLLQLERNWVVCGEAGNETDAMQLLKTTQPHLVLVDLSLGESNGLELIKWMIKTDPTLKIVVLSSHEENLYAERALRAGARGYLNKQVAPETMIAALQSVLAGGIYLNPVIMGQILQRLASGSTQAAKADVEQLSDREMATFELIGAGVGSREIAERLCVSIKTVDAYRQRIKKKLGLSTGPELTRRAVEWVLAKS